MVLYCATLISPDIIKRIGERYPKYCKHFEEPQQSAIENDEMYQELHSWLMTPCMDAHGLDTAEDPAFGDALHYALQLMQCKHGSDFNTLASQALGLNVPKFTIANTQRYFFDDNSLERILSWEPLPWDIPSDAELSGMETALTEPKGPEDVEPSFLYPDLDLFDMSSKAKWYFSAAAVAINFRKCRTL